MNGVWKKGPGKDLFEVLEKVPLIDVKSFMSPKAVNPDIFLPLRTCLL